jgi:lipopolysaccharide transport system ATP-binding protein
MSNWIIKVEGLGKKYQIRHQAERQRYVALRDVIAERVTRLFRSSLRKLDREEGPGDVARRSSTEEFWALKDVSFEVAQGEVVGIIGRNGAGKSTLLKILGRITEPTKGRATLRGRVASLLEVGTGFHPELTGRENIYLNGAILGMSRAEVLRKFDAIVAFAEVEQFLDTPVKRYSSGMYVRLAFAIAAHLEPEILIVDEVLAVGDAEFQKKCLGKIDNVAKTEGRTVLFVSHNMSVVQHLCSRAVLMRAGSVSADGPTSEVLGEYLSDALNGSHVVLADWADRTTSGEARITGMEVTDENGTGAILVGGKLKVTIRARFEKPLVDPTFGLIIHDITGAALLDLRSIHCGSHFGKVTGEVAVEMIVRNFGLYPGRYLLSPFIMDSGCLREVDSLRLCCTLEIHPAWGPHGDLKLDSAWGKYFVPSEWNAALSA